MVSKPNFVFGIKQTSLHSKEDSQVHTTIWSHTCLSAGSRLHGISQPPWLCAVSKSNKPSKPWLNLSYLCTSSFCLIKPTRQTCSTAYHDQNPGTRPSTKAACATTHDNGSWNSHTRRRRFLTLSSDLSHTRHQDGLIVPQSTWSENLVIIRRYTRQHALLGYLSCNHALVHAFHAPKDSCYCHLTSSNDIITPRQ